MFKLNLRFNSVTKENRKNFGCSTSTKKTEREARDRAREIEIERDERVLCNIKSCGLLDFNNSHGSHVCACVCVFADTWRRRMTGKQSRAKFESLAGTETQPETELGTESNDEQDACIWSQQKTKFYLPTSPAPPLHLPPAIPSLRVCHMSNTLPLLCSPPPSPHPFSTFLKAHPKVCLFLQQQRQICGISAACCVACCRPGGSRLQASSCATVEMAWIKWAYAEKCH